MPTPVSAARACLTQEAVATLDEAVAVARRRGHAQTTSLHMVSSLLSIPNSSLREACTRTRHNAYSTRLQLKALELSLSVSLDRLPSSRTNKVEEPPVSNSLMAAIKRSQANQRRQPENFSFYQQQYSSCSSVPVVKVELRNLIISILDDPLVSRVLGEAGFRSCDIKIATLRPVNSFHGHHLFGYSSRYKRPQPPLFLCNFNSSDSTSEISMTSKSFNFPFMGGFPGEENSRRIGEIMIRDKKKNPLLLGVSASDALKSFLETVQKKGEGVLPGRLIELNVICVEDDVLRFVNGDCDEEIIKLRFVEVEKLVQNSVGSGVVINFGDLKALGEESVCVDALRYVVGELGRLLQIHAGKLWLIGAAATYEIYYKSLNRYPSIEKDWDLEILPITSFGFSTEESFPRSSLMESFVPLGGFFSTPSSDMKSPLSSSYLNVVRCQLCNEKCEQEVNAISNGAFTDLSAEKNQSSFPSWMQKTEHSTLNGVAPLKLKDDGMLLSAKIAGVERKWDGICQRHHYNQPLTKINSHQLGFQFPRVLATQVAEERKENACNDSSDHTYASSTECGSKNRVSIIAADLERSSSLKARSPLDVLPKSKNLNILSESGEKPSALEDESSGLKRNPLKSSSSASINNGHTSPTSTTSVTRDLSLHIRSASTGREPEKLVDQCLVDRIQEFSGSLLTDNHSDFNPKDPKMLYRALIGRVGQQEEAVQVVVETIAQHQTKNPSHRRDLWFNFQGPDRLGKKRLAVALCEILYGSIESLICVDLSFQDAITHTDTLFNLQGMNTYDVKIRGKTVVDYLAENLSKKPSIVFLENIEKADPVVQNRLSHAVKTGRFSDLQGREVNFRNSIFVTTTRFMEGGQSFSSGQEITKYSEENILRAKGWPIQMLIGIDLNDDLTSQNANHLDGTDKGFSSPIFMSKRKLIGTDGSTGPWGDLEMTKRAHKASNSFLDLNLPAEGSEIWDTCSADSDCCSISEDSRSWLEDFIQQIDKMVVFKPFDFDGLSDKILKDMEECLCKVVGTDCLLETEPEVIEQLLAATYLKGCEKVEDWMQNVLKQGFIDACKKFSQNACFHVKLVSCKSIELEETQVLLPARIIMN